MADKKTPKQRELTPEELQALEALEAGGAADEATPDEATSATSQRALTDDELIALEEQARKAPAAPPKDPGFWRTLGRGMLQGFFKQGADEAAGALASTRSDVIGHGYRMPDGTVRDLNSRGDVYRAVRDTERDIEAGAREFRPKTAFVANMAGDIASDAVLGALGVPVGSTPYQVASGALSGFLGNDADLSTEDTSGRDVASALGSAALGGAAGYVLPKVGNQIARAFPGAMARLRQGLESSALDKARKVLTNGADQLSNRNPVADSAVREALDSGAIPIWGTTEGAFRRLEDLAEVRGQQYASIVERLERAGVPGPNARALADELLTRARSLDLTEMNPAIPNEYRTVVGNILDKAEIAEQRGLAPTGRLGLTQAEDIKRSLQAMAKYGRREDTPLNEARKEIASIVRQANEDAVDAAGSRAAAESEVAQLAGDFVPVKQRLSRTLEARSAAERGAAKAAQRVGGASGVSLMDVANATQATGQQGLPAMALAGASRIWRERGPSTLANIYDVGAEAAGNLSRASFANPDRTRELARVFMGPFGRQFAASTAAEEAVSPTEDRNAAVQRAIADYLRRRGQAGE